MSAAMQQQFQGLGIRFRYPDDWRLSEEMGDDEVSITLSSPESAFWSATVMRHRPDPEEVLQTALDVFRDQYDDVDVEQTQARLANREVPAADVDFVCFEMISTARLRAFRTEQFTVLVLSQSTDADQDDHEDTLAAISDSLVCESDLEGLA
jgi:hypothetical protein